MRGIFITNLNGKYKGEVARALRKSSASIDLLDSTQYEGVTDHDYALVFGVAGVTRRVMEDFAKAGKPVVYTDKGYIGGGYYHKISPGGFQPQRTLVEARYTGARWEYLARSQRTPARVRPPLLNIPGPAFLVAYSAKYSTFHDLPEPTTYWTDVVERMVALGWKRSNIIYRPKPTWDAAVPIPGTQYAHTNARLTYVMRDLLNGRISLVVTHGSNGAVRAVFSRVPIITLGNGPTRSVSVATELCPFDQIRTVPAEGAMQQWAHNLAYCQYTTEEIESGLAIEFIERELSERGYFGARCDLP